jgi:hypothetical protein
MTATRVVMTNTVRTVTAVITISMRKPEEWKMASCPSDRP